MAGTDMLATFSKHIEDMRNLSLCKICIKPFYEPFILSCGHTYCYSCLASWFGGTHERRSKKSCPDCRAKVRVQPSPNYILRDLVHMFIGRAELLPENETVEEHQLAKEEEAVLLAADRTGPGLFKGAFLGFGGHPLQQARAWQRGILDLEDNVVRCPECHWELEDGECNRCGFHEFDVSGSDSGSEDGISSIGLDDSEMDDEDDLDPEFTVTMGSAAPFGYFAADPMSRIPTFSDDDDEEDGEESGMDQFIDDEAVDEGSSDSGTTSTMTLYNRQFYQHNSPEAALGYHARRHGRFNAAPDHAGHVESGFDSGNEDFSEAGTNYDEMTEASENGDEDEDDEEPVQPMRQSRPQRVIFSSDDEDEEEEGQGDEEVGDGTDEDEGEDEEQDAGHPELSVTEPSVNDSDSEDSDIVRPPQSSMQRRQHLDHQRARRGGHYVNQQRVNPEPVHHGGRGSSSRYVPYQRPPARRIPVGGPSYRYPS